MLTLRYDVVDATERARLRAALDAAGWEQREIADRFRLSTGTLEDPLIERLVALATSVTGAPLQHRDHEWLRLMHGDYQLMKGDALTRPREPHVELIADLSAAATGEAEIFYSDGRVVPQLPGVVTVLDRDGALLRWQRYITQRVGGAAVYRLLVTLVPA